MDLSDPIAWRTFLADLDQNGYVRIPSVLTSSLCKDLQQLYEQPFVFRNTIDMKRYRFGLGEYKYFAHPLPAAIAELREKFYSHLASLANDWMTRCGLDQVYPEQHKDFVNACHAAGQIRPTPLMLRYEAGGYNTLHQDLYGKIYFPFQVVFLLNEPGRDFQGGEFVMTENVPRAQSKARVIAPAQGDAVIFTTNFRPVMGTRGFYRATMKHGISAVTTGQRFALGIIFHDAA